MGQLIDFKKHIRCWTAKYQTPGGFEYLVSVRGPDRDAAIKQLRVMGYTVAHPEEVKPVLIVAGHNHSVNCPEYRWWDGLAPTEDRNDD